MSRMSTLRDIRAIHKLAAERLVQGMVTVGYGANRQTVAELFNDAFEQNLVAVESYREIVEYIGMATSRRTMEAALVMHEKLCVPLSDGFHLHA